MFSVRLEQKLAARRAKLSEMKQDAEQSKEAKKHAKQKDKDKLDKQLVGILNHIYKRKFGDVGLLVLCAR